MQLSFSLTSLLALCLAVCTLPSLNAQCVNDSEVDCHILIPRTEAVSNLVPKSQSSKETNADRLSRGLPLLPPTRRSHHNLARAPRASPVPTTTFAGHIEVFSGGASLGFIAADLNYWTPLVTPDINSALGVQFSLPSSATSGTQVQFVLTNDGRGSFLGLVVGRDSTTSDIASGSFNYLYLDPTSSPGTAPGATPQSVPSFFSTSTGLDKAAETSVWNVDVTSGTISVQWINSDGSSPATQIFLQSNHVYAGGDPNAFQSRFPAPVTTVTLKFIPG